jgi:hypothetical protein
LRSLPGRILTIAEVAKLALRVGSRNETPPANGDVRVLYGPHSDELLRVNEKDVSE